jgi:NTE family protein
MVKDNVKTASVKNIGTRLNSFSREKQGHLINWGYAITDTALRKWYFKEDVEMGKWPISEYSLEVET